MFTILLLLLGIIIIAIFVMRQNFSSHLDKLDAEITNSSAPSFPRNDLPPIVMVYVARVGVNHQNISKYVSFDQAGQMWSAPSAKPFDFTAMQIISTNEAEFV